MPLELGKLHSLLERLDHETAGDLESESLEIKGSPRNRRELRELVTEAAVCFANQRGGCLIVGIKDRTRGRSAAIEGIGDIDLNGLERDVYDDTDPSILVETEVLATQEGRLLAVRVPRGLPPHTTSKGLALIRVGSNCMPLTGSALARAVAASGGIDRSAVPVEGVAVDDMSNAAIEAGRETLRHHSQLSGMADLDARSMLKQLGIVGENEVTMTATLLFGTPSLVARHLPQHEITVVQHARDTRYERRIDLRGPLLLDLRRIEEMLETAVSMRTIEPSGFTQLEIPSLSWEVAREAILNAIAHRDYFLSQGVIVAIHPDHVEVQSPGGFIGGVTPENVLRHQPVHRNVLLARALQQLGLVNRAGIGIDRIYEGLLRAGSRPPSYRADESSVAVTLPLDGNDELAAWIVERERESDKLELNDLLVIRMLMDEGWVDRRGAARCLQLAEADAASHLAEMRARDLLVAQGRGRGTTYRLPHQISDRLRGTGVTDADRMLEAEGVRLKILDLLRERGKLTNAEIRAFSGYTREQVLAVEKALEREGLIEFRGRGRGAHIVAATDSGQ